jgi:hypothetical protein
MMDNEMLARHIGIMARAEADGNYASLQAVLKVMTMEEVRQAQLVLVEIQEELREYERKAS